MYGLQDEYGEVRSRLQKGVQILAETPEDDNIRLGMALIQLHSALESFVRLELIQRAPLLRTAVEDLRQTSWKDLLGYAKSYLGFSEEDCRIITEANALRLKVAHGREYKVRRAELVDYARFVQRWCNPGAPLPDLNAPRSTATSRQTNPAAEVPRPTKRTMPAREVPPPKPQRRTRRSSARILSCSTVLALCLFGASFLLYRNGTFEAVRAWFTPIITSSLGTLPAGTSSSADEYPTGDSVASTQPAGSTVSEVSCAIVWVEHQAEELSLPGKNRAMVWVEFVRPRVQGSGMTDDQFYSLVIEHNPDLKLDGYTFVGGKTYFLPECE